MWFPLWSHIPVLRVVFLIFSDEKQLPKQVGELITEAHSEGDLYYSGKKDEKISQQNPCRLKSRSWSKCWEQATIRCSAINETSTAAPPRLRDHWWVGSRRNWKSRRKLGNGKECCLLRRYHCLTLEVTVAMITCTKSAQGRAQPYSCPWSEEGLIGPRPSLRIYLSS